MCHVCLCTKGHTDCTVACPRHISHAWLPPILGFSCKRVQMHRGWSSLLHSCLSGPCCKRCAIHMKPATGPAPSWCSVQAHTLPCAADITAAYCVCAVHALSGLHIRVKCHYVLHLPAEESGGQDWPCALTALSPAKHTLSHTSVQ